MCPNCEAQYEVSDSVIPLHGRDVQCSNCGQTWFQTHPQSEPDAPADEDDADYGGDVNLPNAAAGAWDRDETDAARLEPEPEPEPEPAAAPSDPAAEPDPQVAPFPPDPDAPPPAGAGPDPDPARAAPDEPEDLSQVAAEPAAAAQDADAAAAAAPLEPKRRSLDEAVLSVLREEAEREARARRAAGGVETQTDMNLPVAEPSMRGNAGLDALPKLRVQPQAESRVADLSSATRHRPVEDLSAPVAPEVPDAPAAQRQSRRDRLPDIEEFSSSLQANGGKSAAAVADALQTEPRPVRRSGFRTGFLLVIVLAVLVFGLYAAAPAVGSRFPAAVPLLDQFVATVDNGRVRVDQLMQTALDRLKGAEKPVE